MRFAIRAATKRDYDALNQIIDQVDALHREHLPHIFQKPDGPPRDREYVLGSARRRIVWPVRCRGGRQRKRSWVLCR